MKHFVVIYSHPDEAGWKKHLPGHIAYLQKLVGEDNLVASGSLVTSPQRSTMLVIKAKNSAEALEIVSRDPFSVLDLIGNLSVTEWNPVFVKQKNWLGRMLYKIRTKIGD